jgi:hypothetical protein
MVHLALNEVDDAHVTASCDEKVNDGEYAAEPTRSADAGLYRYPCEAGA